MYIVYMYELSSENGAVSYYSSFLLPRPVVSNYISRLKLKSCHLLLNYCSILGFGGKICHNNNRQTDKNRKNTFYEILWKYKRRKNT